MLKWIYIVAFCGGLKCWRKIHFNTQWPLVGVGGQIAVMSLTGNFLSQSESSENFSDLSRVLAFQLSRKQSRQHVIEFKFFDEIANERDFMRIMSFFQKVENAQICAEPS